MEKLDWLAELRQLKYAIAALVQGYPRGTYERENAVNASRGVQDRLQWCIDEAKAEVKRGEHA